MDAHISRFKNYFISILIIKRKKKKRNFKLALTLIFKFLNFQLIYFISILIGENTQSRVDVKLAHFFPILKKPERKKMAFRAEVLANQIAIIKSIDRDSSRWRCSITGSAYLDNRKTGTVDEFCHINRAKTLFFFFFVYGRVTCVPIALHRQMINDGEISTADDRASMGPHLSWRPHLFSTTQVFHPNGLFPFAVATGIVLVAKSLDVCFHRKLFHDKDLCVR